MERKVEIFTDVKTYFICQASVWLSDIILVKVTKQSWLNLTRNMLILDENFPIR